MSHIECTGPKNGKYLRIVKERVILGSGGKHKKEIIKTLGSLKKWDDGKPDFLKRLREQYQTTGIMVDDVLYKKEEPKIKKYQFTIPFSQDNPLLLSSAEFYNYGYTVPDAVLSCLKIDQHLGMYKKRHKTDLDLYGILRLLVLSRILEPKSKLATFAYKDKFFGIPFRSITDVKDVYRALDILASVSLSIQKRINTTIVNSTIGRKVDLIYYDVTNYYFETAYGDEDTFLTVDDVSGDNEGNDELVYDEDGNPIILEQGLRKKGVSKENRSEPIVQMGLFIDQNGIPISFDLFPGSTHDQMTFPEMIKERSLPMSFGRVVVVADNGMHNQYNLYELVSQGNGYIMSKSLRKSWKSMREFVLDQDGYKELYFDEENNCTFKYKSQTYDRVLEERDKKGNKIVVKEKLVVFWSKAHADEDARANAKFVEYLESCKEHPEKFKNKSKIKKYFKPVQINKATGEKIKEKTTTLYELNEAELKAMQEVYGYYAIVTSETDEPDIEIIRRYHNLSRIEDSFRITKSDLAGRPVYVRTKEHIKAHFLICFIALVVIRIIQNKYLKMYGAEVERVERQRKRNHKDKNKKKHWREGITAKKLQEVLSKFRIAADEEGICIFDAEKSNHNEIKRLYKCLGTEFYINEPTANEARKLQAILKQNFKI